MNWLEFIFKLISNFVPISDTRIRQLEADGMEWYKELKESVSDEKEPETLIEKGKLYLKQYGEHWACQTGFAILFIFANRWVHDFMNPSEDNEDRDRF